jgi:hypothetical protein
MTTKKKMPDAIGPIPKPEFTQQEVNVATRKLLLMLEDKLRTYSEHGNLEKLKIKFGESKPLKPLYTDEGGKHVGYIQQGPRTLSLVIEDYTDDGKLFELGY